MEKEPGNSQDRHAVALVKDGIIVGYAHKNCLVHFGTFLVMKVGLFVKLLVDESMERG